MERLEKIIEEAESSFEEIFEQSCKQIQKELERNWKTLKQNMRNCFAGLFQQIEKEGIKGEIKYLLFSHLYSSCLCNLCEYRIDLFNEKLYLDTCGVHEFFSFSFLQPYLNADKEKIRQKLEKRFIRLREYEIQAAQWKYQFYYHSLVYEIILRMKKEISELGTIQVLFGEYMGRTYEVKETENHEPKNNT